MFPDQLNSRTRWQELLDMAISARYDEVRAAIVSDTPDARIQELFEQFLPSLTLDYVAPARLGLAAYICARRPQMLIAIFRVVAADYFQLGITSDSDFQELLKWAVSHQRDVITRHGDIDSPEWLQQSFELYRQPLGERLAELEKEFRLEDLGP